MADESKQLFPSLPENLKELTDDERGKLLADHEAAKELILEDNAEFLEDLTANEIIAQLEQGVEQIKQIKAVTQELQEEFENYQAKKQELVAELEPVKAEDEDPGDESDSKDDSDSEDAEKESTTTVEVELEEKETVEAEAEPVLVTASTPAPLNFSRRAPIASPERTPVVTVEEKGTALVAAAGFREDYPGPLGPSELAHVQHSAMQEHGPAEKNGKKTFIDGPHGRAVFDGPRVKSARADFGFDGDRTLTGSDDDVEKIRNALPEYVQYFGGQGGHGGEALVASGGLCAPLTPIYSMPNFATEAEPVWDALPVFRAARGGVNVPTATYIADIDDAISSISESDDALGGTFATKSCQALECPDYTETAVQIIAHCREYGNLNARAWPEKIAHENALTMAALARTSESFMLDRIKALSVNVTNGLETLGALIYLLDGITKSAFGIRSRFRMPRETRFRALLPAVTLEILLLDTVQTQFDRYRSKADIDRYLNQAGIDPVYYLDTPSTGTSQIADSAQTAAAIDPFPDNIQWAIYPEGAFIGVDMGVLELGIVRDSTLNSTNDFQVFGERFRNVARIAPEQAAFWVTTDLCATGQFPPTGTARTCD
jgi:hypothetical protein